MDNDFVGWRLLNTTPRFALALRLPGTNALLSLHGCPCGSSHFCLKLYCGPANHEQCQQPGASPRTPQNPTPAAAAPAIAPCAAAVAGSPQKKSGKNTTQTQTPGKTSRIKGMRGGAAAAEETTGGAAGTEKPSRTRRACDARWSSCAQGSTMANLAHPRTESSHIQEVLLLRRPHMRSQLPAHSSSLASWSSSAHGSTMVNLGHPRTESSHLQEVMQLRLHMRSQLSQRARCLHTRTG